jgi:hypothetical protein
MLSSASMQNDSREGEFLFVQLALEAIIGSPGIRHLIRAGAVDLLNKLFLRWSK